MKELTLSLKDAFSSVLICLHLNKTRRTINTKRTKPGITPAAKVLDTGTLVISVPIFLVFGLGSSLAAIAGLNLPWSVLIQVSFGALTKHVLIAVPLFIFTGMAMLKGGAASRLVKFTTTLVGHWPGGLGVAMVIAMGFFAAFCGSILAAITAVGTIMMPKMIDADALEAAQAYAKSN